MEQQDTFSNTITNRIRMILADNNMSVNKLKDTFGMNQSTLNKQIKGDTPLPMETLGKIIEMFPDISMEWLMKGEGSMKKGFINQMVGRLGSCGDGDIFQSVNGDNADELRKRVKELKEEKERLLGIIEKLTTK